MGKTTNCARGLRMKSLYVQQLDQAKEDADKLAALRTLRDMKLQETDFYALSDVTLADNMKTYRQNLRDITDSYQSLDADGFAWPTKPS